MMIGKSSQAQSVKKEHQQKTMVKSVRQHLMYPASIIVTNEKKGIC